MLMALTEILAAIVVANLYEWIIHKHLLHGMGRKKGSLWSSHWSVHHAKARRNGYIDDDYQDVLGGGWSEGKKEVAGIFLLALIQVPTMAIFPWYSGVMVLMAIAYFLVHRQSHLYPDWARKWVAWHYDHHMGKRQDANWCVTFPLWDHILGTRVKMACREPVEEIVRGET
jgi:sterol desaturase/sphingolipid hydroxylase (fatty acid hydroxylase superfamily)